MKLHKKIKRELTKKEREVLKTALEYTFMITVEEGGDYEPEEYQVVYRKLLNDDLVY